MKNPIIHLHIQRKNIHGGKLHNNSWNAAQIMVKKPMAHILIAEDDPSMRQFLTMALEKAGHHVTSCADGLAAFYAIEAIGETIDLLLADIVMPGMDGIELSQKATKMHPHIKILFITGFSAVAVGKGTEDQTPARVLSKPFHLNDLVAQITEIVGTPSETKTLE